MVLRQETQVTTLGASWSMLYTVWVQGATMDADADRVTSSPCYRLVPHTNQYYV